jgi:hypothetical protein
MSDMRVNGLRKLWAGDYEEVAWLSIFMYYVFSWKIDNLCVPNFF